MTDDGADEVMKKLLDRLKNRYQNNLESMKGSDFVFGYVHLSYYKCCKIKLNRGRSYLDSPDCIKKTKNETTVNLINKKDNKCFQYTLTVILNHKEIKKNPQNFLKR